MNSDAPPPKDLSALIADDIREAILSGDVVVDQRLPSEAELAEHFQVSRPTVREALKRLAAQSLIRTQRGASGGAFVRRLRFEDAYQFQVTQAALLLSMNEVGFDVACEARFVLERGCVALAAERRGPDHLSRMIAEVARQKNEALTDEEFCASDVAFHRALVDAAGNPVLSFQLAGAVEGMQPLMNMITFSARSRARIVGLHEAICLDLDARNAGAVEENLHILERYTKELAAEVSAKRKRVLAEKSVR
jgi:DNA-binding FadR family transcriptional regulator